MMPFWLKVKMSEKKERPALVSSCPFETDTGITRFTIKPKIQSSWNSWHFKLALDRFLKFMTEGLIF